MRYLIVFLILCVVTSVPVFAQLECGEKYVDECANSKEYIYLKSRTFPVNDDSERMKFFLNLRRKTEYKFTICDANIRGKQMILKLYNINGELMATSYDRTSETYHEKLIFTCQKSGKYLIKTFMKGEIGGEGCGAILLEMRKGT